jgi:hypothetical protein
MRNKGSDIKLIIACGAWGMIRISMQQVRIKRAMTMEGV